MGRIPGRTSAGALVDATRHSGPCCGSTCLGSNRACGSSGLHVAVSVLCLRRFDTAHQYGDEACIEGDLPGQWVDSPRHMSGSIAASMPRPKQKPASQVVVKAKPGAPCLWCAVPDRRRSCRCGQIRRARRYAGLQNGVALLLGHMLVLMLVSVSVSRVCAVCVRGRLPLPRA